MIWICEIKSMQENGTSEVKRTAPAGLRRKIKRVRAKRRRRKLDKRARQWAGALEMTGGGSGLIGAAGVPLLRLLAELSGLRGRLSGALARRDFAPGHDRGQVLIDVAVGLAMGVTSVAGAVREVAQAEPVTGAIAAPVTAWRALTELDAAALDKIASARAAHRRQIWDHLAKRPEGFPWVQVAGQIWQGWIVLDVDATLVECHSDKQGAAPTYKRHIFGLHPLWVRCANTGEHLAAELRRGNAGSNTVADHLTVLKAAIGQLPARYRRKVIFRVDGAGATKELLTWIKDEAAARGHDWRYVVGFAVTEPVRQAIVKVPAKAWTAALTPGDTIRAGARVTDITGLLTLAEDWPQGMRVLARTEPLHPRHHKNASDLEKRRGQRFCATATDLPGHHYPRLEVFARQHAVVEDGIKDAKNLGLRAFPFHAFAANQAWCLVVTLAADLLAWLRLLALDHHAQLRTATPATLRQRLLKVPARLVRRARKRLIRLPEDHPGAADLILAWSKIRTLATATSPP
ncbi:IS1380 family transposase [Nonomuraea sp. K274]|uniref:IS1380 family transposase n=1 Tax=Nonomuraea cypriaca TaxID=1187855 RepID=A0A931F5E9_9ACTN|nr:IS1380 family transposase [Nonomuraea cypriaca]MBF8194645.1 IS1380 family transposase [Nonomuraea cypriaca]